MTTEPAKLIKVSVAFEPEEYTYVLQRAQRLYGRRGMGQYIRQLVKADRSLQQEVTYASLTKQTAPAHD